jgi:predicted RecB family endonuclease
MTLYDAAWAYNLGATELNRSVRELAAHLERVTKTGGAPDPALLEAQARVRLSLTKQREAEDAFWNQLRASE